MKIHELALELLSKKWPLTARVIYFEIKKQKLVSYQAVHKALKQMVKEKILAKEGQKYQINSEYIAKMREKWVTIEQKYYSLK